MTTLSQHHYHHHLATLLPPADGRTPAERLHAIAASAFNDSKFTRHLTPDQREEAFSHTLLIAARAILDYDPDRDQGTGTVPIDRRVGQFIRIRCQQRIHDWYRANVRDTRPGRSPRPTVYSLDRRPDTPLEYGDRDYEATTLDTRAYVDITNLADTLDLEELVATNDRILRYHTAATRAGLTLTQWALDALDHAADLEEAA